MKHTMLTAALSLFLALALIGCSNSAGSAASARAVLPAEPDGSSSAPPESAEEESGSDDAESCSSSETSEPEEEERAGGGHILIAYFTWSGNTEEMASYIAEQTGGDLLALEPAEPYPEDYDETGEIARTERDENQRPEIADLPDSIGQYDAILVGYPIWWHTAPMIIGTFLEHYDLTGVEVYPFAQSASMDTEQFENSMDFVRACAAGANVHDGLFAEESDRAAIDVWLTDNLLTAGAAAQP